MNQARWNSRFIALQIQAELMGKSFPNCQWEASVEMLGGETKL